MVGGFSQHQALHYLLFPTLFLTAFLIALYPSLMKKCHGLLLSPPMCPPVTLIPAFCREQRLHGHHGHAKHQQVLL